MFTEVKFENKTLQRITEIEVAQRMRNKRLNCLVSFIAQYFEPNESMKEIIKKKERKDR